jgi:hypothetical protein
MRSQCQASTGKVFGRPSIHDQGLQAPHKKIPYTDATLVFLGTLYARVKQLWLFRQQSHPLMGKKTNIININMLLALDKT